jgi:hypothetical protein
MSDEFSPHSSPRERFLHGNLAVLSVVAAGVSRWRLASGIFLCLFAMFVFAWLLHAAGGVRKLNAPTPVADAGHQKLQFYKQEIGALQDRMAGLLGDSIESKLKTLETRMESGAVGADDLRLLEDVKSELRFLESQAARGASVAVGMPDHERYRLPLSDGQASAVENLTYSPEARVLLYASALTLGMAAFAAGGYLVHSVSPWRRTLPAPPQALLLEDRRGESARADRLNSGDE